MYLLLEIRGRGLKPPGPPGSTVSKNNNGPNLLILNESPVSGFERYYTFVYKTNAVKTN